MPSSPEPSHQPAPVGIWRPRQSTNVEICCRKLVQYQADEKLPLALSSGHQLQPILTVSSLFLHSQIFLLSVSCLSLPPNFSAAFFMVLFAQVPAGQVITENGVCCAFLTSSGEDQAFFAALAPIIPQKQGTLFETVNIVNQNEASPTPLEP